MNRFEKEKDIKDQLENTEFNFEKGFKKLKDNVLITVVAQYLNSDHNTIA